MSDLAALAKKLSPLQLKEAVHWYRQHNKLAYFRPYPKQYEFYRLGAEFRERMLFKGNKAGGTICAAYEIAMHATGRYPDWWPGRRYDRPLTILIGSESNEASRDIIQKMLFGTTSASLKAQDMGTGALPHQDILAVSTRQAGVRDVIEAARIKHLSGGESLCLFKSYEMGRTKYQGFIADIWWPDEEPPGDIYSEGVARTATVADGMVLCTFTALKGETDLVRKFTRPAPGDVPRAKLYFSIHDAVGGTWPEGTPWAGKEWKGHFTAAQVRVMESSYPEWERETRTMGLPMYGEGRVFPFPEAEIRCDAFPLPQHFRRMVGIDFGIAHPFAAVEIAHTGTDGDVVYVTKCFRRKNLLPPMAGASINAWGGWQPIAWPHDGENREKGSGEQLHRIYRKPVQLGGAGLVNMLGQSARYQNDKGGSQDVEPIVTELMNRMGTGRLKVFAQCAEFFEEYRSYHRKDGVIQAIDDDILKACMYALMMLRYARPEPPRNVPMRASRPAAEKLTMGW